MSAPLPLTRLHLTARADAPLHLPPYAGSMLRGAFGHALLALSPLPHADGKPCALHTTCPYCQVFATPPLPAHSLQKFSQMPQPYVIEPPSGGTQRLQAGQTFHFGLVLIGQAIAHQPAITLAWERALRTGLGGQNDQRSRCTLLDVQRGSAPPPAPALGQHATLHLLTPLRLQYQGKPSRQHNITARNLLVTLARRYQLLQDIHLGAAAPQQDFATLTAQAEAVQIAHTDLRWFDWGRYSQRQQQEMKLGGLLGSLQLHGNLTPFAELLHLGQWLHVGKNTSFGLGGYRLAPA